MKPSVDHRQNGVLFFSVLLTLAWLALGLTGCAGEPTGNLQEMDEDLSQPGSDVELRDQDRSNNFDQDEEDLSPDADDIAENDEVPDSEKEVTENDAVDWPTVGDVIFTEIMFDPKALDDNEGEWIELFNLSDRQFNLKGCAFSDREHSTFIEDDLILEGRGYLIFGVNHNSAPLSEIDPDWAWGDFMLDNDADKVTLSCNAKIIDNVVYDIEDRSDVFEEGTSLSLCPGMETATLNDEADHWQFSTTTMLSGDRGTPRHLNDACNLPDGDEEVEIELEKEIEPEFELEADDDDIEVDVEIETEEAFEEDTEDASVETPEFEESDEDSFEEAEGVDDEVLDEMEPEEEQIVQSPNPGDVVFNELMPYPLALERDEGQWIELYNPTDHAVNLNGCDFITSTNSSEIDSDLVLEAQGYVVIGVERSTPYINDVELDWTWGDFVLHQGWESLTIRCGDIGIDTITYSEANMGIYLMFGSSLSLCEGFEDMDLNDIYGNWRTGGSNMPNGDRGTPGEANESCTFIEGDVDLEISWEDDYTEAENPIIIDTSTCISAEDMPGLPNCDHFIALEESLNHEICVIVPKNACHKFWLGNMANNYFYYNRNELPRHKIYLTEYALSRYPVTVEEYRQCIEDEACTAPVPELCHLDGSYLIAEPNIDDDFKLSHPVNCVNRYQALEFCQWAGGTLPSEAQWEHGAVGPMGTPNQIRNFPWGEDPRECHTNIWGADPFDETSPVGFFDGSYKSREEGGWSFGPDWYQTCSDASPFGLHDMTHNVSELVLDYPSAYDHWENEAVNPVWPPFEGTLLRGGNWVYSEIHHARCHVRHTLYQVPSIYSSGGTGFRCKFDVPE